MVYFRKRLTPEVLGEINEMIVRDARASQAKSEDHDDSDDDSDHMILTRVVTAAP